MIIKSSYIDINHSETMLYNNKAQIDELIRKKLIQKDNIDTNYYDIITNKITIFEIKGFVELRVFIDYTLKRKSCWNDLEECEKRLKIGL